MRTCFSLLLGGTLLAACQSSPPKTQDEAVNREAVVKTDSAATAKATAPVDTMGLPAGSVPTIGSPKLLLTLDDAHNTPDGLALAPNGHLILSVPNLADTSQPAVLMEIDGTTIKPFATNLPVEPTTKKAAPMAVPAPTQVISWGRPGTAAISGQERTSRNIPAVTIVAACIKAEAGVGPSIASGSQK